MAAPKWDKKMFPIIKEYSMIYATCLIKECLSLLNEGRRFTLPVFLIAMLLMLPGMASADGGVIKDADLEAAIRAELKLYGEPLSEPDLLKLTSLYAH
jgi:hypothetical protein